MALLRSREHRERLRADFRRFYGKPLSAPRAEGWPLQEFADCVAHLPPESATARHGAEHGLTLADQVLLRVEHGVRVLAWQQSKDGSKGANYPEPLLGAEPKETVGPKPDRMSADEMKQRLGWTA